MPCPCVLVQPALQILVSQSPVLPILASSILAALSLLPSRFNLQFNSFTLLPAIMRESLVGFGHAMHIFFFLHGPAASVRSVDQLVSQFVDHGLARAFPRILQQPPNRQRLPAKRIYFDWNLIVRTAYTSCFYFQQRLHVLDGLIENLQRIVVGFLGDLLHRAIKRALRRGFLAFPHHRADELIHQLAVINWVACLRSASN